MKTRLHSILTTAVTALAFTINLHAMAQVPTNSALAHSPRFIEENPELARSAARPSAIHGSNPGPLTSTLTSNRAWAASPRYIEEHPELARVGVAGRPVRNNNEVPAAVLRNKALAASPRVREEYPSLTRGHNLAGEGADHLQIAPVK